MNAILVLSFIAIFSCIFYAVIFLSKRNYPSSFFLGIFFLLVALKIGKLPIQEYASSHFQNIYFNIMSATMLAIGPVVLGFISSFYCYSKKITLTKSHFIPSLILLLTAFHLRQVLGEQIWLIIYWITLIHPMVYASSSLLFLRKNPTIEKLTGSQKIWLYSIPLTLCFIVIINLLYFLFNFPFYLVTAALTLLAFYMVTFFLFNNKYDLLLRKKDQKYQNITLKEDEINELHQNIIWLLKEEKLYLNEKIKLSDIAERLDTPSHILSMVINKMMKKSFPEYINELRIDRAQQKLILDKDKNITEIAYESGFSSLSTFNRVFKQLTDTNPSEYRAKFLNN